MITRYYGKINAFRAENKNEETANKRLVDGRWERLLHEKMFAFLTANYMRDKFSGYKYRIGGEPDIKLTDKIFLTSLIIDFKGKTY
jgi:hypothetical protein